MSVSARIGEDAEAGENDSGSHSLSGERSVTVLHCIPTFGKGGAEQQLKRLVPHLPRRGINVAIFSRFSPDELAAPAQEGVTRVPIRSRGNYNPQLPLEFVAALRAVRPQIVQTWLTQMDILGGLLIQPGMKWVLSERSSALGYPGTIKNRLRFALGSRADAVVANSPSGLRLWKGAPQGIVIPNGVDIGMFDRTPAGELPGQLRNRKVVLTVSRLIPGKRIDVLIDAIDLVRKQVPEVLLVVLGEGPERRQLEQRIASCGLDEHVMLNGYVPAVAQWMKSADLFVSASRYEGQPNAVLEAAAAGLPMVLSDIAEHRGILDQSAAVFVSPAQAEHFASAILQVLRSDEVGRSIAASARRCVELSSFERVADCYTALYKKLAADLRQV